MSKKGAVKTGGHGGIVKAKNQSMAADLKKRGIIRHTCRDPLDHTRIIRCNSVAQPGKRADIL